MRSSSRLSRRWTRAPLALAALLPLLTSSCKLLSDAANAPGQVVNSLTGGSKPSDRIPPGVLQSGIMRFADSFAARIHQAANEFAEKAGTPEAKIQALTWSSRLSTSALTIATGPNANVALLDMVVLVTLGRMVHEEYLLPKVWGEVDRPMLEAFQSLEKEVWEVASLTLTPEQQEDVRATLSEWRTANPDMERTAFVRLPAFHDILKARKETEAKKGNGLGDLLSIDPLGGLEPAVREIERSRLLAERAMFYVERAPLLLSTEVELLGLKMAQMPEVRSALEDAQRISVAAANIGETAAKLPESVRMEREAAVKQVSDELTRQREGLVANLDKVEGPTRKILNDAKATLEAGTQLSTALQGTVGTVDHFLDRFEKKPLPAGAPPPPPAVPGKPFDITEYGDTAERLGVTVRELNGLVTNLDQRMPQLEHVMDEAVLHGQQTIDHAFARGIQLAAIVVAFVAIAVLLVRWISARRYAPRTRTAAD